MPLTDLLFTMLNRKGITLSLELRNYMKTAHPGMELSKTGYLKQRMKLNPLAFYELYRHHNRNFYAEPGFSTFQGYLVLAADGSGINTYYRGNPERIRNFQQKRDKTAGFHRAWMLV